MSDLDIIDYYWGQPQTPEFNALSKKMKYGVSDRSEKQTLTSASPSFFCPTPALGLALQHHLILLVGFVIISLSEILKEVTLMFLKNNTCNSISNHYNLLLGFLNNSPTKGAHLIDPNFLVIPLLQLNTI